MAQLVKLERYKVAYFEDRLMKSRMFPSKDAALGFTDSLSSKTPWTIMEAKSVGNGEYEWEVLKEGTGSVIIPMALLYPFKWPLTALLAIFIAFKLAFNKTE